MVKCDILWENLNYPLAKHDDQTLSIINKQLRKLRATNGLQLQALGFVHFNVQFSSRNYAFISSWHSL